MGFFSNLIKKAGKFIASVFRDVEKPVKETEKTVKETAKVFEDTGLKAFRGFQKFIEAPIEVEEEPEEVEEEYRRKIFKETAYAPEINRAEIQLYYALTYENNDIDRSSELKQALREAFGKTYLDGFETSGGYDDEYLVKLSGWDLRNIYPNIETSIE